MKKFKINSVVAAAVLIVIAHRGLAVPVGHGNDAMNYMLKAPDLSRFGAGVYYTGQKRDIVRNGAFFTDELSSQRAVGYLGFDLFKWMNVYAVGGYVSAKLNDNPFGDGGPAFGGGVSINLLNHFIREPATIEDAIRINAGVQVLANEAEVGTKTFRWLETSAALTFALVNHTTGSKFFSPESIAIYAGPALSVINSTNFDVETKSGVIGGIEIFFTDSCALDLRVDFFDNAGLTAGVNLRF